MAQKLTQENVRKNYLLASLNDADLERMMPHLSLVDLELGKVLYEAGDKMDYAYFPTTAIVSLLYMMESGSTAEIGVIGNDGIIGLSLLLGGDTTTNRAVVQSAGSALKISAVAVKVEFSFGNEMHDLMLRYTQALMTQISQTAVCNRLHPIEQQLCRWLLLSHDRLHSDRLVMTHELISNMLGVRREGVTLAAQSLAARNLITNRRGTITVSDRKGLEDAACECYGVVKTEYDRILGWRPPQQAIVNAMSSSRVK
ncbi:MAG: Crp/Fnr family transcriptional regulator [bacterium]|nr:Crp/Fnr family transcriptional regulator [bacterium]